MVPNIDPRDRFVYPYLTLMIDSFSCTLFCAYAVFLTLTKILDLLVFFHQVCKNIYSTNTQTASAFTAVVQLTTRKSLKQGCLMVTRACRYASIVTVMLASPRPTPH